MDFSKMTPEQIRAAFDAEKAKNEALVAENEALKTETDYGVKPVRGTFKTKLKVEGVLKEKKFSFVLGSPIFFTVDSGAVVHAESIIKIANGETVTAESLTVLVSEAMEKHNTHVAVNLARFGDTLSQYTKEVAQRALDSLAAKGYQYLKEEA